MKNKNCTHFIRNEVFDNNNDSCMLENWNGSVEISVMESHDEKL